MRFSITLIAACASIMTASAQLPDCVQGCVDRVSAQYSCADPEYTSGISDCATEACGDDASAAIDYLDSEECPEAGDATTTEAESTVTTTAEDGSETTVTTTDSEGEDAAVTTSPLEATVSASDTTYVTTTGFTTITGDDAASSAISSVESSVESVLSSVSESAASETSAAQSSDAEASASETQGGGGGGASETTSSEDIAVAGATLAPMAGALGVAALLFV